MSLIIFTENSHNVQTPQNSSEQSFDLLFDDNLATSGVRNAQKSSEQSFDLFDNNLVAPATPTQQKSVSQQGVSLLMEFDNFTPPDAYNSKSKGQLPDSNFLLSLYDRPPVNTIPHSASNASVSKTNYQSNSRIITQPTVNKQTFGGKKHDPFESLNVFPAK